MPLTLGDQIAYQIKALGERDLFRVKAASPVLFGDAGGIVPMTGDLVEGVDVAPRPRVFLADLFAKIPVTAGGAVTYPVVHDAADLLTFGESPPLVGEAESKVPVGYEFDDATANLVKLAVFTKMSSELTEDAPALARYIDEDLVLQVRAALDAHIYSQIAFASSPTPEPGENQIDLIIRAAADIEEAGHAASVVIMSPTKAASLRLLRGLDGQYLLPPDTGLRVVTTPVADQIIVVDPAGGKVYQRGDVVVDVTNSDDDDFVHNMLTLRAEMRAVFGITFPSAFAVVPEVESESSSS